MLIKYILINSLITYLHFLLYVFHLYICIQIYIQIVYKYIYSFVYLYIFHNIETKPRKSISEIF